MIIDRNRLLMTLLYWLKYRLIFILVKFCKVRLIVNINIKLNWDILVKLWFSTTCWVKALINDYFNDKTIVCATESSNPTPKDKTILFWCKEKHTIKTQVIIEQETKKLLQQVFARKKHELCFIKESKINFKNISVVDEWLSRYKKITCVPNTTKKTRKTL
ncbi:hypothetical protein [Spiroplasma poulsonii]|uniref:hypothetical protein n=1 Tax=Spiroplasma poulsonii TaxID=2138 RepID=UPI001F4CACCD|nr:hypothetical protein [Spiroplasma poulsonii]UNF62657.1 hypothetical protein MNU24_04195 [Spiroplasma poulsonii]